MKRVVENFLQQADIQTGGGRPWDLQVHDPRFYRRVLLQGSLGLGESYMDGWWDADRLDETACRFFRAGLDRRLIYNWPAFRLFLTHLLTNAQRRAKAYEVAQHHYDLGNDLFQSMLDRRLVYTCGYWQQARTLDEAQEAKMDLICRKLGLQPGMSVLDIGCGWGSFGRFAAERYGVRVVGVTVSRCQYELGLELVRGLPVELRLEDYRETRGTFDRVVSIGMFEAVGVRNFRTFMRVVHDRLASGGLFLLHTIGQNSTTRLTDVWAVKYIFPNGMLPSVPQIGRAVEGLFVMEDWHNFGAHYDRTLLSWFENFNRNWHRLRPQYGDRFYRKWKYFLMLSAGFFRSRRGQLWQIVLSRGGVPGGYFPERILE